MTDHAEREALKNLNARVDVLCLMQKRWTHDRSNTVQWAEQERATAEYQEAVDAYREAVAAAVLASARERVEAEERMCDRIIDKAGLSADDCDVDSADPVDHVVAGIKAMRDSLDATIGQLMSQATHPAPATVTDEQMADAMMAFNGWDRDDSVRPATKDSLRSQWIGDSASKRDSMYAAVKRAVLAALGGAR